MPSLDDAVRDPKNVHWFCTDANGVWVFSKPGADLKFYAGTDAAAAKGAPKLTAMRRDEQEPRGASAEVASGSAVEGTTIAGARRRTGNSALGSSPGPADGFNTKAISLREQAQKEKREEREASAAAEKAAIAEAMEFARQKDRKKAGQGDDVEA